MSSDFKMRTEMVKLRCSCATFTWNLPGKKALHTTKGAVSVVKCCEKKIGHESTYSIHILVTDISLFIFFHDSWTDSDFLQDIGRFIVSFFPRTISVGKKRGSFIPFSARRRILACNSRSWSLATGFFCFGSLHWIPWWQFLIIGWRTAI